MSSASDVLGLYRNEPRATRLHTAVRWRTCPFEAVAESIPRRGRVLEIGCGHGLFSTLLAVESEAREVVGTDVDGDKIQAAQRVAARSGRRLDFVAFPPGELPEGVWDAIAIVDVLYLIDAAGEESLLRTLATRLAPGGVLVVKEMAQHPRWKFRLAQLQERISVQVLGITEGEELTFVPPDQLVRWMEDAGLVVEQRRLDHRYLHPHHLVVGRRPAVETLSSQRDSAPE